MTIELVTGVYGIAMSLAPLLQARRMIRRRSSRDVSLPYLMILLVGFVLYLLYGISISNRVLISTNVVAMVVTSGTIAVAVNLRRTPESEADVVGVAEMG